MAPAEPLAENVVHLARTEPRQQSVLSPSSDTGRCGRSHRHRNRPTLSYRTRLVTRFEKVPFLSVYVFVNRNQERNFFLLFSLIFFFFFIYLSISEND